MLQHSFFTFPTTLAHPLREAPASELDEASGADGMAGRADLCGRPACDSERPAPGPIEGLIILVAA